MIDLNDAPAQVESLPWERAKAMLLGSAQSWVPIVFPNGRRGENGDWRLADVSGRAPRKQGSLCINMASREAGKFAFEFDPAGQRGYDPIGLIGAHFRLEGSALFERASEIIELFPAGINGTNLAQIPDDAPSPAEAELERSEQTQREIQHLLDHAGPIAGTPAEAYYRARGLEPPTSDHILFHATAGQYAKATTGHPTIIALVYTPEGEWTGGIHRTFLKPDGSHHIGGDKAKMMLGPVRGGLIHFGEPDKSGLLLLGEGPESTLSAQRLYYSKTRQMVPCWSCMTAGGMGSRDKHGQVRGFAAWLLANRTQSLIKRVLIAVDRDDAGRVAGGILAEACARVGLPFELYQPAGPEGSDFNDDLLAGLALGEPVPFDAPAEPELPLSLQPQPLEKLKPEPLKHQLPPGYVKPEIKIGGGDMAYIVRQVEEYLMAEGGAGLYQYGQVIVRGARKPIQVRKDTEVTYGITLVPLKVNDLLYHFNDLIRFAKPHKEKGWTPIDCPLWIAQTYLERRGAWELEPLMGVVSNPIIRPDGSLLETPGYDRQTRLLYDPLDIEFPPIPSHPTKAQAAEALKLYLDLVSTFPFYDAPNSTTPAGTSLAVAISAMLTTPFRRSMPTAPMHCFNAPIARSGKSKLADICSIIATGHAAAPLGFGKQPEEFEKRLGAALMQGNALIAIDNVSLPLESDTLCTMLTQTMVSARILGASALPELPSSAMILCNGNNLVLVGDLAARALMCTIDPQDPRPEMRDFSGIEDVLEKTTRLRPELIVAGLTILLAYAEAGYPNAPRPLGSFEIWSKWVRGALLWLGLADPVASIEEIRTSDPALDTLEAVMYAWNRVFPPGTSTTSHELIDAANKVSSMGMPGDVLADRKFIYADLREALLNVAGAGGAGATLNNRRLGKWLSAHKNRIVQLDADHGRLQIRQNGSVMGAARWVLEKA